MFYSFCVLVRFLYSQNSLSEYQTRQIEKIGVVVGSSLFQSVCPLLITGDKRHSDLIRLAWTELVTKVHLTLDTPNTLLQCMAHHFTWVIDG